jgi:hypothetical protein
MNQFEIVYFNHLLDLISYFVVIAQVFLRSSKTVSKDFLMISLGLNEIDFQEFKAAREWTIVDNEVRFPQGTKPIHQKAHEKLEFSRMLFIIELSISSYFVEFGQILQTLAI